MFILHWIWDAIVNQVPWQVWAILGTAAVIAAWRFLGTRGALALGAVIASFVAYTAGRNAGWKAKGAQGERIRVRNVKRSDRIETEVEQMTEEEIRAKLKTYTRKD